MPKQYMELEGVAVLRHSVLAFQAHSGVSSVHVVIHPDDVALYEKAVAGLGLPEPVFGGETRQESVRLGLERLVGEAPDQVLIHDGARPFVDAVLINRVIAALVSADGAIPALPLTDTIKRVVSEKVIGTEDRSQLWRAQTPQGFRFLPVLQAHRNLAGQDLTDDAAVCEAAGLAVTRVDGNPANIKITTIDDMRRTSEGAKRMETRSGMGFDVHRFTEGTHVTICGIDIPHTQALEGHSDADVGLHALTDALLGAIGAGDIGLHFPPSEAQWRGAPSDRFVSHAVGLIKQGGGRIVNVDVTLICEAPKMGGHRAKMQSRVAEILEITEARVNIKATTTEKLGFTGRAEGIAAQAVATIEIENWD